MAESKRSPDSSDDGSRNLLLCIRESHIHGYGCTLLLLKFLGFIITFLLGVFPRHHLSKNTILACVPGFAIEEATPEDLCRAYVWSLQSVQQALNEKHKKRISYILDAEAFKNVFLSPDGDAHMCNSSISPNCQFEVICLVLFNQNWKNIGGRSGNDMWDPWNTHILEKFQGDRYWWRVSPWLSLSATNVSISCWRQIFFQELSLQVL